MTNEKLLPGELVYWLDKTILVDQEIKNVTEFIKFLEELLDQEKSVQQSTENIGTITHALGKALFFTGQIDKLLDDCWQYEGAGITIYRAMALLLKGLSRDCLDLLDFDHQFFILENELKLEIAGATAFANSALRNEIEVFRIHGLAAEIVRSSPEYLNSYLWCLERYAYNLRSQNQLNLARESYNRLLDYCLNTNTIIFRTLGYKGLGHLAEHENDYERALAFYDRALYVSNQYGLTVFDPIILNRKGISVTGSDRDLEKARSIFESALEKARQINAPWLELGPLANLASISAQEWKLEEARDDFIFLRDFQREFGDKKDLYWILMNLAAIDTALGNKGESKRHLHEANHIQEQYKIDNTNRHVYR
ncbi:MAG: hypothetical protein ACFFD4_21405 [Candidatus Odinarchaeota archaeon]